MEGFPNPLALALSHVSIWWWVHWKYLKRGNFHQWESTGWTICPSRASWPIRLGLCAAWAASRTGSSSLLIGFSTAAASRRDIAIRKFGDWLRGNHCDFNSDQPIRKSSAIAKKCSSPRVWLQLVMMKYSTKKKYREESKRVNFHKPHVAQIKKLCISLETIQPACADTAPPTGLGYGLQHYWFCTDKHISSQCCDSGKKRFWNEASRFANIKASGEAAISNMIAGSKTLW